jgi:hypothetical protein
MLNSQYSSFIALPVSLIFSQLFIPLAQAAPPRAVDKTVECELLVVGGGLAGSAAAYEALLLGKTVCMTEITDWVGGQLTSQGTSALDEKSTQTEKLFYSKGYLELRDRIKQHYETQDPGKCWVSKSSCFLPSDGHKLLMAQLKDAETKGNGKLNWFPSTVVKTLDIQPIGTEKQIKSAIAIQHQPAKNTPPLNTYPLSQTIEDAYRYEDSERFTKTLIQFIPKKPQKDSPADWYVIEATETGEIIALADVPYRLGIDTRSYLEPSSSSITGDPYCTQGFTYTFAMEATEDPQTQEMPSFYPQYEPYYSYNSKDHNYDSVFTYRRIWSPNGRKNTGTDNNKFGVSPTMAGEISMQNWLPGNDYTPGTSQDNLIYTRQQLQQLGQVTPDNWMGGLRVETLRKGEENALGFYYWLVAGTTDANLGDDVKKPNPNNRFLSGLESPMGTVHGLSKYPYIREARRIIGRPNFTYPEGFTITEIDISRLNYQDDYYRQNLSPDTYRRLHATLAGLEGLDVLRGNIAPEQVQRRKRSTIYPDSVGIGHYNIDFHPCYLEYPVEKPGNIERPGERQGHSESYPFQIPLRAMIPQKIDNLLVVGKSIATSHIAAAAYRVHSFEWSSGAAAGVTATFALNESILPYQLVSQSFLIREKRLMKLRQQLQNSGNPTAFPDTSIFKDHEAWK